MGKMDAKECIHFLLISLFFGELLRKCVFLSRTRRGKIQGKRCTITSIWKKTVKRKQSKENGDAAEKNIGRGKVFC